jgi:hypothetical protein
LKKNNVVLGLVAGAVVLALLAWLLLARDAAGPAAPPPTPIAATPDLPVPSFSLVPTPTPTPAPVERVRVEWRRTGAPVTGVLARAYEGDALRDERRLDGEPIPGPWFDNVSVEFYDEPTSLLLAVVPMAPPGGRLPLPEPVRVRGTLVDDDGDPALTAFLRLGHGETEFPSDRFRRLTHSQVIKAPDEDAPWGLALRPTPARWHTIHVGDDGGFSTPWFVADGAPQFFAWDNQGRSLVHAVDVARGTPPRSELTADLRMMAPTGLEVTVDFPPGETGFPIALGIKDAELDPAHAPWSAQIMGVLDIMNADVGRFATSHGNVHVTGTEPRRFAPLPAFTRLTLVARGATTALVPEREIAIRPGEITRVHFERDELFPTVRRWARLEGVVKLEETGRPVPDAQLVATWLNERAEAVSDADGRFAFPRVAADQELVVYLEAYDAEEKPRWSHTATRDFDGLAGDPAFVEWEIPGMYWMILEDAPTLPDGEIPYIVMQRYDEEKAAFETWGGNVEYYFPPGVVEIELARPGTWRALVGLSDFVLTETEVVHYDEFGEDQRARVMPPTGVRDAVTIEVIAPDGSRPAGLMVMAAGPYPSLRPVEFTTDANGRFTLGPANVSTIEVRIEDDVAGWFGGAVDIGSGSGVIRLAPPEDDTQGP